MGLFELERKGVFSFTMHAATIEELADHLAAVWLDSRLQEEMIQKARDLLGVPGGDKEITLREPVHITRFKALE